MKVILIFFCFIISIAGVIGTEQINFDCSKKDDATRNVKEKVSTLAYNALNNNDQIIFNQVMEFYKKCELYDYRYNYYWAEFYYKSGVYKIGKEYIEKAIKVNPQISRLHYTAGYNASKNGLYKEAENYYKTAIELDPEIDYYYHSLGRNYQKMDIPQKAIEPFKKYLQIGKGAENKQLVVQFLKTQGVNIDQIMDSNKDLAYLLQAKNFTKLEEVLQNFYQNKTTQKDEIGNGIIYKKFEELIHGFLAQDHIEEWVKAKPQSTLGLTALGYKKIEQAWAARGKDVGITVTENGYNQFQKLLNESKEKLSLALKIDKGNNIAATYMLKVARGLKFSEEEMNRYFFIAITGDKKNYEAYQNKLTFLEPKWYGSISKILGFLEEIKKIDEVMYHRLLLDSHQAIANNLEHSGKTDESKNYFNQKDIWTSMKLAYTFLIDYYPQSDLFVNNLVWRAHQLKDYDILGKYLSRAKPWGDGKPLESIKKDYEEATNAKK